ncbi:SOS response-associated peptidase [Rhodobacteraceae bacterium B1Z28]|uniref:Abasic site processing protein n=1 Tax=Ruegeria haliotis TaxID=2747601 RepID=A0ABX2PRV1_9RHOB|nr:SOS response-associated peptidase [Ruegeria haliotis]NVO55804.1 SOS response-associated peptidase [Ruegeria haliotis]
MCGRFAITLQNDPLAQMFEARPANALPMVPNYNVCPTNQVHVVRSGENGRKLDALRWGFLPHWYKSEKSGPLLINARAETLADKPAFQAACRARRCLVVATGFYEWTTSDQGARLPWYIHRQDNAPIAFAGVWQDWGLESERQGTCAIVTTAANQRLSAIHHRMPLILEPADWPLWLGEAGRGAARLMTPGAEDVLAFHRTGRAVNSNRASGPDLIEALVS